MQKNRVKFISIDTKAKIRNYFFKNVKNNADLIYLINIINQQQFKKTSPLTLAYIKYHAYQNQDKYKMFRISKKSGEKREIVAPVKGLKNIQRTLNIILSSLYKSNISAHGFIHTRSVVSNAKKHINKNYVYNIDLSDFFPSIHQARIWKRLQVPPYNFSQENANLVSALVCYQYNDSDVKKDINNMKELNNFLPQGAPTSPIISNIICERLDKKLLHIAKKFSLTYTRYADDITFSSNHNVYHNNSDFVQELQKIIESEHFSINVKKTRLQTKNVRQMVTGVVVNKKVNVHRQYIKTIRMLIHILEKYGLDKAQLIYIENLKKEALVKGIKKQVKSKSILNVISGKLEYLKMIKGSKNTTYIGLKDRFDNCFRSDQSKYKQFFTLYEIKKFEQHNPIKMIDILSIFDVKRLFKATIKPIITNSEYNEFMFELKKQWRAISQENRNIIHNSLLSKIYIFLFETNVKENGWGSDRVKIGWSSPELKKWIEDNSDKSPHNFTLNEEMITSQNKSFLDVMNTFNKEIEIRPNDNSLYDIFFNIFDDGKDFRIPPKCDNDSVQILKNAEFYIDTQQLKHVFQTLADYIISQESRLIVLRTDNYIELYLCLPFECDFDKNNFINSFRMAKLIKNMFSMCDFRVECFSYANSNHKSFYFLGLPVSINDNKTNLKGNQYILRFYT